MPDLIPGGNVALREVANLTMLRIGIEYAGGDAVLTDRLGVAAIAVGAHTHHDDVVFANQPTTADESTRLGRDRASVDIVLSEVPDDVERIAVVLFWHPATGAKRTLSQLRSLRVVASDQDGRPVTRSRDLVEFASSTTSLILTEVYRRNGEWKLRLIAQGFANGLPEALNHYEVHP